MSEYVYAGLTSQTIDIFLQDSSSTTGAGLAGLAYNTAGLVASYRKGATGSRVAITLATQTVGGAYSSGGFVEIDATHLKGVYRLDVPNAAVDTEGFVTLYVYGATNLLPTALRIDCRALPVDIKKIGADTQSATDLKDFADAGYDPVTNKVQGVVLVDTCTTNTDIGELGVSQNGTVERTASDTNAITFGWPVSGATITGEKSINNGAYAAVSGAIAFLRTESSKHYYTLAYDAADRPSVEGQVRYKFVDGTYTRYVVVRVAPAEGDATAANQTTIISALTTIDDFLDTEVAAIKAKTDNLPTDPADASDISASFSSIASTLSTIAMYIDTEVAAIKTKTDNLPSDPADASDIIDLFSTVNSTLATIAAYIDTEVAAIKSKTDNLPADPADASDISSSLSIIAGYIDTEIAAIKAKTDLLVTFPSNFSSLDINASGHVSRVSLVDVTTQNTDMVTLGDISNNILNTQMTESYAADGVAPTLAQALFLMQQAFTDFVITGNNILVKKLDGSTTAATYQMDSDTAPTLRTRVS